MKLRRANVALCRAESEKIVTPEVDTADFIYYRFRQPEYSARRSNQIAEQLRRKSASGRDVFAFFKHEENLQSALNALDVLLRLKAEAA